MVAAAVVAPKKEKIFFSVSKILLILTDTLNQYLFLKKQGDARFFIYAITPPPEAHYRATSQF